jgi:hypothetical protein
MLWRADQVFHHYFSIIFVVKSPLPYVAIINVSVLEYPNNLVEKFSILKGPLHVIETEMLFFIYEVLGRQKLKKLILVVWQLQKILECFIFVDS